MKRVVFVFLFVFVVFAAKSQVPFFALKVMGGVNFPSFTVESATTATHSAHYVFSLDAMLGKKNYFQGGFALRKYKGVFTVGGVNSDLVFPVINFHAYYGHQILGFPAVKLRLFTGLGYDMLDTPSSSAFVVLPEDFNSSVYNFVIGTELKAAFFLFSLQYELGLTDMFAKYAMKNNIFIAKVGVSIF
jgi:hypothetical protein